MATWKIQCDVLVSREGETSVFPEMEIVEKEIHLVEDFVINIFKQATEIAKKELAKNSGYLFVSIDRTDKKTGKNYYQYIVDNENGMGGEPELKVVLDERQRQVLSKIQDSILSNCFQKSSNHTHSEEIRTTWMPDGILKRLNPNVSFIYNNWGEIMSHEEYNNLTNFYRNVTKDEIAILNMKERISVEDYDVLKKYYTSLVSN